MSEPTLLPGLGWDVADPTGWDEERLAAGHQFAREHHSTDLVILHEGRVVLDESWEPDEAAQAVVVERLDGHRVTQDIASAQKSVTSVLIGIAASRGIIGLSDRVSDHLGDGWTGCNSVEDERAIHVEHLLTMTAGLADDMSFVAPPGQHWDYNLGAAYHTLKRVLTAAAGETLDVITQRWLKGPLGMTETSWVPRVWNDRLPEAFRSMFQYPDGAAIEGLVTTGRDLATFGFAVLRGCSTPTGPLGVDEGYRMAMTRPSQELNPAYGCLWWLNGQPWYLPPKIVTRVDGPFFPGVPSDAYAALGAHDRLCVVVPSLDLVVARCGASAGEPSAAGSRFARELLGQLLAAGPWARG